MLIAKIRTSNAGWLYKQYDYIETKFVPREELLKTKSPEPTPTIEFTSVEQEEAMHPNPEWFYHRIETYGTEEAKHMNLFCVLWGTKEGEIEIIAFDTEGYILNENGKTIEKIL